MKNERVPNQGEELPRLYQPWDPRIEIVVSAPVAAYITFRAVEAYLQGYYYGGTLFAALAMMAGNNIVHNIVRLRRQKKNKILS